MRPTAVLAAVVLAGCSLLGPEGERFATVDSVIGEVLTAVRAPANEQKAALARAQQAYLESQTPLNRVRLAAFLTALPPPLRDDARASELLEPVADASAPGPGRLAALLAAQIAERQRITRELERAMRETERLSRERERADREREKADKERDKREEALRQQLDALRSIERGILEREERLRKRPR